MKEAWHSFSSKEAMERLKCGRDGLTQSEAKRRLEEHGPNELERGEKASPVTAFLKQFLSPLIYVLMVKEQARGLIHAMVDTLTHRQGEPMWRISPSCRSGPACSAHSLS